ncbi:MAG: peptidase prepilin type [Verrucomicrobia bacterium]|nr:peptidase prepilin type [Verrucomicrobiota bacterium]
METLRVEALTMLLMIATWTDLRGSRIPNWLNFSAMGLALVMRAWFGGLDGVVLGLIGMGTGLALFLILYCSGSIGAGDVKLMAAVGALVGPSGALLCGFLAILVGGVYALGAMCYQWGVVGAGRRLVFASREAFLTQGSDWARQLQLPFRLRYGIAVAGGTLLFELGIHPFGA